MSPEWLNVVFTGGTFVVIAVSAIAALAQLRHLRSGYQVNGLLTIMNLWQDAKFQTIYRSMARLSDPEYLAKFDRPGGNSREEYPELLVCDFWEQVGTFVKYGYFDEHALFDISAYQVISAWEAADPIISRSRNRNGPASFENFEYIAVRARMWLDRHPNGAYPANVPRWHDLKQ